MRTTIDFGIDLGTTNSSISVMEGMTPVSIKNNDGTENTPSCVFIDKNKKLFVGRMAYQRVEFDKDNAKSEFKRLMGQDSFYTFKDSGLKMRPEELSAEVLKYIKASVRQRLGEEMRAAVITVPAGFGMPAIEATKRAAEMAGFSSCALLQEPVAAATAYGFQKTDRQAFWLVYDIGGGTFDAAVIELKEGQFWVMDHGGADFGLAGKDMDWQIVEKFFIPAIQKDLQLSQFDRGNPAFNSAFAKLKYTAEKAKIELSNYETTSVLVENLIAGKEFAFEFELSRAQVETVALPIIRATIEKCREIISKQKLAPKDFQKVILVGGPTLAPYLRDMVADPKEGLGIPIDFSVDPFTVVSQGAAIFAHTQILESSLMPAVKGKVKIDLQYDPIGSDAEPVIGGKAQSLDIKDFTGFSIQLDREGWTSGRVTLKENGAFITSLLAERGHENKFRITLYDAQGSQMNVMPDEFTYIIGNAPGDQVMINTIGVALMNNQMDAFCRKGEVLPAEHHKPYKTLLAVEKGKSGDFIRIPVVEGEDAVADYNKRIGELFITGENIPRSVPIGSEVEVTIKVDKNRILETLAYVPVLDQEFVEVIDLKTVRPEREALAKDLEDAKRRMQELDDQARRNHSPEALEELNKINSRHPEEKISALVTASGNAEDDAGKGAEEEIRQVRKSLDKVEAELQWPVIQEAARKQMDDLRGMMAEIGEPADQPACDELFARIDEAIQNHDITQLQYSLAELGELRWQILTRQPSFWVYMFDNIKKDTNIKFTNADRAQKLIREGDQAILDRNVDKLQGIVAQLFALIPQAQVQEISRGYGSTLMN